MSLAISNRTVRSGRVILPLFLLFGVVLAYFAINSILSGHMDQLLYVCLCLVVLAFTVTILKDWRTGLYLFFAWLLFEDLSRKFLGNDVMITFGKDGLVAVVYISFLAALRRKEVQTIRPPFLFPVLLFFWFAVIQMFNPASTSLWFGALGLKLYFYYMPLFFVGYALVNSEAELKRFLFVSLSLAVVISSLGIVQAVAGHTFLNPEHPQADIQLLSTLYRSAPISGAISYRPTSVFVSAGRFADYIILSWLMAFGIGGYLILRSRKGRTLALLSLGVLTLAAILSDSRGVVMWTGGSALVCAAAFLWGAPWRQGEALRIVRTLQRSLAIGGVALLLFFFVYPEALKSRLDLYSETLSLDSPASELLFRARDYPLRNFLSAFDFPRWVEGYGTGTQSLGTQYIVRLLHVLPPVGSVENGYGTIVIEMGLLGLLLWILWTVVLLVLSWKTVRKLKGSPWFPLAFTIWWFALLLLIPISYTGISVYQDYVINAYFWLLMGILYRLPSLAAAAKLQAVNAAIGKS